MSAPKATEAAVAAVQQALWSHRVAAFNGSQTACSCDRKWRSHEDWRAHLAVAAADAAAPHIAAQELRAAAGDIERDRQSKNPPLGQVPGSVLIGPAYLNERADRIEGEL